MASLVYDREISLRRQMANTMESARPHPIKPKHAEDFRKVTMISRRGLFNNDSCMNIISSRLPSEAACFADF